QGVQYQVEKLDWEEKKAYVREVDVDYFTDANLAVQLQVLEQDKVRNSEFTETAYGDVAVHAMATIFKKIKFDTHENIGSGPIHLPEEEIHTSAAWISLEKDFKEIGQERLEQGLIGAAHSLKAVVSLYVMCDPQDVHIVPQVKANHNEKPTIFIYDHYPGGIGLSEQVYKNMSEIIGQAKSLIEECPCAHGCPACIGTDTTSEAAKEDAVSILGLFLQ
ncbi:MAG TPA: Zn-binding domain-containing protein, partial [Chondromyces sp.]|nr:Zn-binding domain-containing protein [Chondromyces sp.]